MKNYRLGIIGSVLVIVGSLTACTPAVGSCQPKPLEVSSDSVAPGGRITVSSPKAGCALDPRTYRIAVVSQVDFGEIVDRPISVDVGPDGSFSKVIDIPMGATPGDVAFVVKGSVRDECDSRASCAGYSVHFIIS
jgi:hypothetical protein